MKYVIQFSGGVGSWAAARRLVDELGTPADIILLFADTRMEDDDLYRFLREAARDIGAMLISVSDGRNPWQVFRDEKYIGNTWIDPCSKILKRNLLRKWIEKNCNPQGYTVVLGIDWTESHRFDKVVPRWQPYKVIAPLCEAPYLDKGQILAQLEARGIRAPRLYGMGFPHNNCGGFCVKAGVTQFALLHKTMPERYAWHERQEQMTQKVIGKPVTVLSRKRKGVKVPLSLRDFRLELEAKVEQEKDDWGGCGCAVD